MTDPLFSADFDRLFVSEDRCTLVRIWACGVTEMAQREHPSHTWGPPILLSEELTTTTAKQSSPEVGVEGD